jgi:hypothetical protein
LKKRSNAPLTCLAALLAAWPLCAAPSVSGVAGIVGNRRNVTISGSGFGTKSPAAPLVWADFDAGLNPGIGGVKRSWDQIASVQWSSGEGVGGTGCAKAADGDGVWMLRADYAYWTNDGQKMYMFKRERLNFLITDDSQNWKSWRMWPAGNGYPNVYIGPNAGLVNVENVGVPGFWGSFKVTHTGWSTQELIFKASHINVRDGSLRLRYDGRDVASGSLMTRSSVTPNRMQWNYVLHGVIANPGRWSPGWSSNNRIWADDIYVDTSWSRVMLGNASTFSNCTRLEIQIPTAWGPGSIGVTVRTGSSFSTGSTAYLYVFDSEGNPNSNGFPVTIGSAGSGGPIPTGPSASAGPDAVATVNSPTPMRGSFTAGTASSASSVWTVLSGPGRVEFVNPADPNTMARFSEVGDYILQFTLTAGSDKLADQVRISVIPSTVGEGGVQPKNFFNPTRGETFRIVHILEEPGHLEADILDRTGHRVRALDGGDRPAGEQVLEWDGRNDDGSFVASGIYLVIRNANGRRATSKVAVVK